MHITVSPQELVLVERVGKSWLKWSQELKRMKLASLRRAHSLNLLRQQPPRPFAVAECDDVTDTSTSRDSDSSSSSSGGGGGGGGDAPPLSQQIKQKRWQQRLFEHLSFDPLLNTNPLDMATAAGAANAQHHTSDSGGGGNVGKQQHQQQQQQQQQHTPRRHSQKYNDDHDLAASAGIESTNADVAAYSAMNEQRRRVDSMPGVSLVNIGDRVKDRLKRGGWL